MSSRKIDQVDQHLREWIASTLPGIDVSLDVPSAKVDGPAVGLYLYELSVAPPLRTAKRPPLQLLLRYLITANGAYAEAGHQMLEELLFAAMDNPDFEIDAQPVPLEFWAAFAVPPRPSFTLRVPLRIDREQPRAKRVQMPIVVDTAPLAPLDGIVLGPGDIPLSGAVVEVPSLRLVTRTDFKGRFHFAAIPSTPHNLPMRVEANGFELTVPAATQQRGNGKPVVIRFDRMED